MHAKNRLIFILSCLLVLLGFLNLNGQNSDSSFTIEGISSDFHFYNESYDAYNINPINELYQEETKHFPIQTMNVECSQETPSNGGQTGLNISTYRMAVDLRLNAGQNFELNQLKFNAILDIGGTINEVELKFYQNSGMGPGPEIGSVTIIPNSVSTIMSSANQKLVRVTVDLPNHFLFHGNTNPQVYWVGIGVNYSGNNAFLETTPFLTSSQVVYAYLPQGDIWVSSNSPQGGLGGSSYSGVVSFFGECSATENCTGMPEAGEIVINAGTGGICAGEKYSLSVIGYTANSNISFRWEKKSPNSDGDTWENISSNNFPYLVVQNSNNPMNYRVRIRCEGEAGGGQTVYTDIFQFIPNNPTDCYCMPSNGYGCIYGDQIDNFLLNGETITVQTLETGCGNDGIGSEFPYFFSAYEDYTHLSAPDLIQGNTYEGTIGSNTYLPGNAKIWIDFNDNGLFDEDEVVAVVHDVTTETAFTINIPIDAPVGTHRLRVRLVYFDSIGFDTPTIPADEIDPCGFIYFGEAEDYNVEILKLECDENLSAGTSESSYMTVCPNSWFSLEVLGVSEEIPGIERNWQSSPSGLNEWTDILQETNPQYEVLEGIIENTDFRYKVTCEGDTQVFSDPIAVELKSDTECYCVPEITLSVEPITTVQLHELYNESDQGAGPVYAYEDFTDLSSDLEQGEEYVITLKGDTNGSFSNFFTVFIDWNQNGILDDQDEIYEIGTLQNSNGIDDQQVTGLINVPADANIGTTRMRIYKNYDHSVVDSCENNMFGQIEDYSINVVPNLSVENEAIEDFYLYPNPTRNFVHLDSKVSMEGINLYNLMGQRLKTLEDNLDKIDMTGLTAGIYILKIKLTSGKIKSFKIIKE